MTPSSPTVDSTYRSFAELLLRRHRLLADETSDSAEIDALEDRMTALWEKLDESQRQSLNGLGSDLNWARRGGAAAPKARKAEEVSDTDRANLAAAEAAQDPHATLHWLRVCSPAMELKDLAQRRRRAYTLAGLPQVVDVVGEALEKRTPTHHPGGSAEGIIERGLAETEKAGQMSEQRPVDALVADLRERLPEHVRLGKALLQGHGMQYPCDLLAWGTLKRSMSLIEGFCAMIGDNFVCASPLVRLQLDNVLRMGAVLLVNDRNDFGRRVLAGERVGKIQDKHGKLMTDAYLVERLEQVEPGVKAVYDHLSGYVHFSYLHVFNAMRLPGDGTGLFQLSGKDTFITDDNRRDALTTMRSVTDLVLETVEKYLSLPTTPVPT
jgi:hypothetical protein